MFCKLARERERERDLNNISWASKGEEESVSVCILACKCHINLFIHDCGHVDCGFVTLIYNI
jgi:hypothetical protein